MATAETAKALTEIEELKKLIDSNEQQSVISILEDKKHIREQKNFNTLIKAAVIKEREEILIWFIRNVYDKNKNAALEMAVTSGIANVIYLALENGANVNEGLYFAVKANQLHVIKLLLAEEADVNYIRNGYTLLHTSIMQNCKLFIVEFLIHKVKDIDAIAKNKKTALEMVQDLLKKKNDDSTKEHLRNIQNLIMLTKQTKTMFECLQGLPDNLRGYTYQIKLLTLYAIVYTKLAISADCEYELGTEATDQVPFDDIYIKEKRNGETYCQFVQVKQTGSPKYNQMKESKFFTILKTEKERNVKEHLKGNDTIVKMFIAFNKISNCYLQNGISGDFVYCTNTCFEKDSCNFFIPKAKDVLLCGVGGKKWQISKTFYLELEIQFILLNLLASSQFITMVDTVEIKEQIEMINNLQLEEMIYKKVNNKFWPVFKIAKEASNAIDKYLNKINECRKNVSKANDVVSLYNNFPEELELPHNAGNFEVYKTGCLAKINEIYKSSKNDKALCTYFSKWEDDAVFKETMNNFIQRFCIYTDCPSTETLDNIITEELCQELVVHKSDIFSSYCLQHFSKWITNFKNERGNLYTDRDGKNLFSDLIEQIFKGFSKIYDEDLKGYNISFKNDNSKLLNFLNNENNNKILHVVTAYPRLHIIKVLQTIQLFEHKSSEFDYAKNMVVTNSEIIFKSDDTADKVIKVVSAKVGINYFILELTSDVHECDRSFDFLNNLKMVTAQNTQSKIILIGKNYNFLALTLKYTYLPSRKYTCYNEVLCFKDLTEESQEKVLQKTITFRNSPESTGIDLKLQNFLTQSAACDFIDEVLLSVIITKSNTIQIGNSSAFYSDEYNVDYYIPRTVHGQILDETVLTYSDKHLFFVTGISADILISTFDIKYEFVHYWEEGKTFDVGIVLLNDFNNINSNDDIFHLISDSSHRNTYWLDIRDNLIFWKGVKINNISEHVHFKIMNKIISMEHSFAPKDLEEKIVILANDAGEGKSTTLTHLAHALKNKFPQRWIVRVDLKSYVNKTLAFSLNNIAFTDEDTSKAVEFVAHMVEKENSKINAILERKIFEAALNGLSQIDVVLIFDGFDEISPGYKEQTCTMLKALVRSKVRQLWVSTRIHLKEYLEEQLQTPVYMLSPFSGEQVVQYLNRFWKWKLKNYQNQSEIDKNENVIAGALDYLKTGCWNCMACGDNDIINLINTEIAVSNFKSSSLLDFYKFIDEVIDLSPLARLASEKWSVTHGENEFLHMPLNLKMFAENIFANKWDNKSFENVQIFEIYKRFVESKLYIYKNIKSTTQSGRPADKDQGDIASVVFRDMHREIAVKTLFEPSWESLPHINICEKHENLFEKLSRIGLMKAYGDRFEFIHRTYAEYFFIEYLALNLKIHSVQCKFLHKILIKKDFFMLRKLFNGFLSQCDLKSDHRVGSNYSLKNILMPSVSKEIVSQSNEEHNNVLHIAVQEGHTHIFVFILNNITIDDFIRLNMKATSVDSSMLHLIIENFHCDLLTITMDLMEKYPDELKHLLLMCNRGGTCLHKAAIVNRWAECEIILNTVKKHEALLKDVLTARSSNGHTPVEYALIYNNIDIVNLFAKTAEENITDDIVSDMLPNIYSSNDTTLHNAMGWSVSEIFATLQKIRRGNPFNLEELYHDSNKLSALHLAAYKGDVVDCLIIMSNYLNIYQIINCPWRIGTPLHLAAEYGHSEVCELIIKFAKEHFDAFEDLITKYEVNKKTALYIAVLNGHSHVCDVIMKSIEYDYDISNYLLLKRELLGRNVLHLAAYMGNSKICGTIIKSAQIHPYILKDLLKSKDSSQQTLLHLASTTSNSDVCGIIIRSAESNPDPDILQYLLSECDNREQTVLHAAIASGSSEGCNVILEAAKRHPHILKFLLTSCDNAGKTPLHKAAQLNYNEVFDIIAAYAINNQDLYATVISKKNKNKQTALHIAAIKGNAVMCTSIITFSEYNSELLRDILIDEDPYGQIALHLAAKRGHWEVCHVIINSVRMHSDILSDVIFKFDINKHTALHAGAGEVYGVYKSTEGSIRLFKNDVTDNFTHNPNGELKNLIVHFNVPYNERIKN